MGQGGYRVGRRLARLNGAAARRSAAGRGGGTERDRAVEARRRRDGEGHLEDDQHAFGDGAGEGLLGQSEEEDLRAAAGDGLQRPAALKAIE